MNVNATKYPRFPLYKEGQIGGLGADAVWAGPWNSEGYPKGKGSSSGKNGIKLRFDDPIYKPGPITMKAKGKY